MEFRMDAMSQDGINQNIRRCIGLQAAVPGRIRTYWFNCHPGSSHPCNSMGRKSCCDAQQIDEVN